MLSRRKDINYMRQSSWSHAVVWNSACSLQAGANICVSECLTHFGKVCLHAEGKVSLLKYTEWRLLQFFSNEDQNAKFMSGTAKMQNKKMEGIMCRSSCTSLVQNQPSPSSKTSVILRFQTTYATSCTPTHTTTRHIHTTNSTLSWTPRFSYHSVRLALDKNRITPFFN